MTHISRVKKRELLTGWMKWTLLPLAFFLVLFIDAWLNIQIREKDYELSELSNEKFKLEAELTEQSSKLANLRGATMQFSEAEKMGLKDPGIHQFHLVAYREVQKRIPMMRMNEFETAQTAPVIKSVTLAETTPADAVEIPAVPPADGLSLAETGAMAASGPELIVKNTNPIPGSLEEPEALDGHATIADPDLDYLTVEDMMAEL